MGGGILEPYLKRFFENRILKSKNKEPWQTLIKIIAEICTITPSTDEAHADTYIKRPEIHFRSFLSYLLFIMEPRKPLAISRPMVLVMVPSMESMPVSIYVFWLRPDFCARSRSFLCASSSFCLSASDFSFSASHFSFSILFKRTS